MDDNVIYLAHDPRFKPNCSVLLDFRWSFAHNYFTRTGNLPTGKDFVGMDYCLVDKYSPEEIDAGLDVSPPPSMSYCISTNKEFSDLLYAAYKIAKLRAHGKDNS